MINVQVKSKKHLAFSTKLGRDKSLCYKAAAIRNVAQGYSPAELGHWTLDVDYWIFDIVSAGLD